MVNRKPIYVTSPFLPPLDEYIPYLEKIWSNKILTNGGPFHKELEEKLCLELGVKHISLFSNGTVALVTALQALRITGEVITTPFSFVATAHSLIWNGIKPVFVDIDKETLNIDASKIEEAITPETTAILPVHCYGRPCDVRKIQHIADKYNLKVIYDAAHSFGVKMGLDSLLSFGDLSVLSFHATKVFNTFEGGAIVSPDEKTKKHIDNLKNFGIVDELTVVASGINGKMSEVNAAFGLLQLKYINELVDKRKYISGRYQDFIKSVKGIKCALDFDEAYGVSVTQNYSYFPILVNDDYPISRDQLYEKFKNHNIFTRKYFYPLISSFPMYRGLTSSHSSNLKNATFAAERILCLPIYPELKAQDVDYILSIIKNPLNS